MSTYGTNNLSIVEVARRMAPDGNVARIAEMLAQDNPIVADMPMVEGNLPTGHRTTVRTGLPTVAWRKLNQGVAASKSTTAQIDEATGMLEAYGAVDVDLAGLNGNTEAFRTSENAAFIEAMNQEAAQTIVYGDSTTAPEEFLGLMPRFDDVPTTSGGAANKVNVIDAGGTGTDNASILLIGWGENTVHGIYPKGSIAGLQHEDLGKETVYDSSSRRYRAWVDHYQWKLGIALRDWRYVVRICNIDVSDLLPTAASGAKLYDLMTRALHRIHSLNGVRPAFYCNRTINSFLDRQLINAVASSTLSRDTIAGQRRMVFGGVPVNPCDAMLDSEARVT